MSVSLKSILLLLVLYLLSGCIAKNDIVVSLNKNQKLVSTISVSQIQIINNQIVITGNNLNTVNSFSIQEGATTTNLQIESASSNQLVANTLANVTFAAGRVFDFILSNASAASTFTVNFSLCDSTLGGKGFDCLTTPNDKDVLSYDQATGKWKPRSINGLTYQGAWNATTAFPTATSIGDYYIVSVANAPYLVGDWIVYNGTTFDHISNSTSITNVFGRTGAVVATKGDYHLTQMFDVDLTTTPPVANQVLKYNGTNWVPGTIVTTETDPTVSAFAKAALPTCGAGQVLKGDGTNLSCVASSVPFSGTANRAVLTDGAGALAVSAVTNTELGYLSGVTSAIQTQLNAKLGAETDPSVALFAKSLPPTCLAGEVLTSNGLSLSCVVDATGGGGYTGPINSVVITNGTTGALTTSAVTNTELGYVSGVTSAIQTQLNAKQATISKTTVQDVSKMRIYGANATNYVELSAATLTANRSLIFPDSNGASGNVLSTDGAGNLSWVAPGLAPVSSVFGRTGAVVAASGDYTATQITNTAAGTITSTNVQAALNELDTNKESIASFAADVRAVVLTGLSTLTNAAITATDSLLGAFGKLQAQISANTTSLGTKADTSNGAQSITAANINTTTLNGLPLPVSSQWTTSGSNIYYNTGNVGIGNTAPGTNTKLSVDGQIRSKSFSIATASVDWSAGNSGTTSFDCGTLISFANMRDGGSYTLVVTGTGTAQCNFDTVTTADDAATVTYRFLPLNSVRIASSHTVYSLQRIGTIVYVSWSTGY